MPCRRSQCPASCPCGSWASRTEGVDTRARAWVSLQRRQWEAAVHKGNTHLCGWGRAARGGVAHGSQDLGSVPVSAPVAAPVAGTRLARGNASCGAGATSARFDTGALRNARHAPHHVRHACASSGRAPAGGDASPWGCARPAGQAATPPRLARAGGSCLRLGDHGPGAACGGGQQRRGHQGCGLAKLCTSTALPLTRAAVFCPVVVRATNKVGVLHTMTSTFKVRARWGDLAATGITAAPACPSCSHAPGTQDLELNVDKAEVDMEGDVVCGASAQLSGLTRGPESGRGIARLGLRLTLHPLLARPLTPLTSTPRPYACHTPQTRSMSRPPA